MQLISRIVWIETGMTDPAPLQRSAEVEDLTNLTEKDKKKLVDDAEKPMTSLYRSAEMEDLAHLSPQDIAKPLTQESNANNKQK